MNIPTTILTQLGSHRFIAMTGSKNFLGDEAARTLSFKIGAGAKNGVTHCIIALTDADLYDVEFVRIRAMKKTTVAQVRGVYADQLRTQFTAVTGFDTAL